MFFKSKPKLPIIELYYNNQCIYNDILKNLPIKESVILEKSLLFFNDPAPCHIHRTAVQIRLTEELLETIKQTRKEQHCNLLLQLCNYENIDKVILHD